MKKIIITTLLVLSLTSGAYFVFANNKNTNDASPLQQTQDSSNLPSTQTETDNSALSEEDATERPEDQTGTVTEPTKAQSETTDTQQSETKISIISAEQIDNGNVVIMTNLGKISDGTCSLVATNKTKTYQTSAGVIYSPQYSSCEGFEIQKSELGVGTWQLSLSVKANDGKTYDINESVVVK